jgi:hypothetical protein
VRIDAASGGTVRLLDGGGEVVVPNDGTYVGSHPTWGTIEGIDNISDGVDEQAPVLSLTLLPDDTADVASITSPNQQGSRTRIWLGALSDTGAVVADPYLLLDGVIDVPTLTFGEGSREVSFDIISNFELLFLDDEGSRLSPASHKSIWPGETGLDDVSGVVRQILWGPGDPITGGAPGSVGSPPPGYYSAPKGTGSSTTYVPPGTIGGGIGSVSGGINLKQASF